MKQINATNYAIFFNGEAYKNLNKFLSNSKVSSVFVLLDTHTKTFCYDQFKKHVPPQFQLKPIVIPAGEHHKNIETCLTVWNTLTELQADRNSVLINLGGGMVTDLGGFVAATFKRGIRFINIPTTLLSMVDASVGSKTGVDLGHLKNLIGLFANPEMVLIDLNYLETLPTRELKSGLAEIVKYGLTFDEELLEKIYSGTWKNTATLAPIVHQSIVLKNKVVTEDFRETGLRKVLNYGHTIGHAVESFYLNTDSLPTLLHGEAIGIGMIVEGYISHHLFNFPLAALDKLKTFVHETYGKIEISTEHFDAIIDLCKHDKKNHAGLVKYVLLREVAKFELDCEVEPSLVREGLSFYQD
ncbi:3-dehydroquinate synthase [Flavobacteriaceae bacterium F08102]|nr:3-dehydroquinate synthase [Flavobacteriaceae bacterium F08102]